MNNGLEVDTMMEISDYVGRITIETLKDKYTVYTTSFLLDFFWTHLKRRRVKGVDILLTHSFLEIPEHLRLKSVS